MMCQCKFIGYKKCIHLVGDADNREGYACVGAGDLQEISVPSSRPSPLACVGAPWGTGYVTEPGAEM